MKTLVVEDGFVSRRFLQTMLSQYGECDIAVNGKEAIDAFKLAWQEAKPYDLICLDIMIPAMDGHEVLKEIRRLEELKGKVGNDGVKVIMTTGMSDADNIKKAFVEQCEAYLVKPIDKAKLINKLNELKLIK